MSAVLDEVRVRTRRPRKPPRLDGEDLAPADPAPGVATVPRQESYDGSEMRRERRFLGDDAFSEIGTAIASGALEDGELLRDRVLAEQMGVSRTPVREAMMDLAREGLVETVKNKGFRVTQMSEKDLDDLAEIRQLLEPPTMRDIVGRIPDEAFDELIELADRCAAGAAGEDLVEYLRNDRAFHELVLSFAGNRQLTDLATSLRSRTRLYGITALAHEGRLTASAHEHHELVRLLRDGDGTGAEALMRSHIGHARSLWATGEQRTTEAAVPADPPQGAAT